MGTFIAIEDAEDSGAGFSLINTEVSTNSNGEVMIPRKNKLLQLFPDQRDTIEKFTLPEQF